MALKTFFPKGLYDPQPVPSWWEASAPLDQSSYEPFAGEAGCEVAGLSTAYCLAKDRSIEAQVPGGRAHRLGCLRAQRQLLLLRIRQGELDRLNKAPWFSRDPALLRQPG